MLAAIAQGFGLAVDARADLETLRRSIVEHVEAQTASDRPCLVLVDDAELLDNKAVTELIRLVADSSLHLVCFGEVRMVAAVERVASSMEVGWQEIRLTGLSEADAREYLEWRFQQARYRGRVPFTDGQVRELVKRSEGLPGRLNQMANVLLVKLETGEVPHARTAFPRQHVALLGLLLVTLGIVYVLFATGTEDSQGPSGPARASVGLQADADGGGDPDPDGDLELAESAENVVSSDSGVSSEAGPAAEQASALAPPVESMTSVGLKTERNVAQLEDSRESAETDLPAAEPGPPPAANESAPVTEEPLPVEPARTAVQEVGGEATSGGTVVRDGRWLLQQNPEHFTLQIVTLSSAERARSFVDAQQDPSEFAIYEIERDGRILHVVIYGVYETREAAQAAADSLPAEMGNIRPWIRPIGHLQAAARLSRMR
ncbi:MAG: hypothetical protein D6773_19985 [Alphaproteobacteria bacterium]|nr:MAG: hypothetical protein D6773_19985 [Alphaproteobacteria bacterium]